LENANSHTHPNGFRGTAANKWKGQTEMMNEQKQAVVDDGLVTIQRVAEFLGVGRTTVYQLIGSGELPTCKIGKCTRIPLGSVKSFAARSLVGSQQ
jgi:excisionase family DNA binding protein